jgi:prepilin-type N-terminal cleavage/methylation domain-containing protein
MNSLGFTLTELIIVMFIIVLLATLAAPALSKFSKTTRVQLTANTVLSAVWRAKSEAMRYRFTVAVFYGDDPTVTSPTPVPNILPKPGLIEMWKVRVAGPGGDVVSGEDGPAPLLAPDAWWSEWYPYAVKERPLTPEPLTFPSGVRIITGDLTLSGADVIFSFPQYARSATGEIKRHYNAFCSEGKAVGLWPPTAHNFRYTLIFDEATGEHILVETGLFTSNTRPRILPYQLTHIGLDATTFVRLTAHTDIPQLIAKVQDRGW